MDTQVCVVYVVYVVCVCRQEFSEGERVHTCILNLTTHTLHKHIDKYGKKYC